MKQLKIISIVLIFVGQACSWTDKQFEEALKSPDTFQGQEIVITGFFHYKIEDVAIYRTRFSEPEEALWVNFSDELFTNDVLEKLDGKEIRINGTFNKDDKGHLGQYAGSLDDARITKD